MRHVALVTGLKHYLGPFDAYGELDVPDTRSTRKRTGCPSRTSTTRRKTSVRRGRRDGFTWSIHRAHTIIGYAVGNPMNMGNTLAV